jgi:hypothetical protein
MLETRVAVAKASSPAGSDGVSPAKPLAIAHQLFQLAPSDGQAAVAARPKKPAVLGALAIDPSRGTLLDFLDWSIFTGTGFNHSNCSASTAF